MKKTLLIAVAALAVWIAGCNSNGINPYGYAVKYEVQERTDLNQTLHHVGKIYYRGNLLVSDIGYASVSPDGRRVMFVHNNKLFYSHIGRIQQVELPVFAVPSDVIWKKYEAVIMFPDRNSETYQLF